MLNDADKLFVDGLEIALGDPFNKDFSHVYIQQCIDIIKRQQKVIEKLESGIVYACPDKRFTALEQSREIMQAKE